MGCVRGCCPSQRDHYRSIGFPAVQGPVAESTRREAQLGRDLDAYKRMRQANLQPKTYQGAAELERRANSRFEVESGRILPDTKKVRDSIALGNEISAAMGVPGTA